MKGSNAFAPSPVKEEDEGEDEEEEHALGEVAEEDVTVEVEGFAAGAYTRPVFGSMYAHFVGYVGCMNPPVY